MDRRTFFKAVAGAFALLLAPFHRHLKRAPVPEGFRRLDEPYFIEPGEPIGMIQLKEDGDGC